MSGIIIDFHGRSADRQARLERQIARITALLEELEDLIFRDMTQLPVRVGSALQRVGVSDPYRWSIPDLLDRIFELQEPILALLRQRSISRRA